MPNRKRARTGLSVEKSITRVCQEGRRETEKERIKTTIIIIEPIFPVPYGISAKTKRFGLTLILIIIKKKKTPVAPGIYKISLPGKLYALSAGSKGRGLPAHGDGGGCGVAL